MSTYNKEETGFAATTPEPTTRYRVTEKQLIEVLANLSQKNQGCDAPHPVVGQEIFLDGQKTRCYTHLSALRVIQGTETSRSGSRLCQFANPEASRTGVFYFRLRYTGGEVKAELLKLSMKSNGREMVLDSAGEIHIVNNVPVSGGGWGSTT